MTKAIRIVRVIVTALSGGMVAWFLLTGNFYQVSTEVSGHRARAVVIPDKSHISRQSNEAVSPGADGAVVFGYDGLKSTIGSTDNAPTAQEFFDAFGAVLSNKNNQDPPGFYFNNSVKRIMFNILTSHGFKADLRAKFYARSRCGARNFQAVGVETHGYIYFLFYDCDGVCRGRREVIETDQKITPGGGANSISQPVMIDSGLCDALWKSESFSTSQGL